MSSIYPSGKVTLVFTDIEGSTRMTNELDSRHGEGHYERELCEPQREQFRASAAKIGIDLRLNQVTDSKRRGVEAQRMGDGHLFVFQNPIDAVRCAVDFQRSLAVAPIICEQHIVKVRIGVHTAWGDVAPSFKEGHLQYPGADTNYASRVTAVGAGEQLLISDETLRRIGQAAHEELGCRFYQWANRFIKDFETTPRSIYELLYRENQEPKEPGRRFLPAHYAGPRTSYIHRPDLEPKIIEPFRTRRQDGSTPRILTLKAEGGMGKTHLALHCVLEMVGFFEHSLWFVDLSQVEPNPAAVGKAIRDVVGRDSVKDQHKTVDELLHHKNTLLVLDNYESVKCDAVRDFLDDFLRRPENRDVFFLVTGRQSLGLGDEQLIDLDVGMPEPEAKALFLSRVRRRRDQDFTLSATEEKHLNRILRLTSTMHPTDRDEGLSEADKTTSRLSGSNPLALVLAAARFAEKDATLKEIADGLEETSLDALHLPDDITVTDKATHERQASMMRSFEWSYNLLRRADSTKQKRKSGSSTPRSRTALAPSALQRAFSACGLFADPLTPSILADIVDNPPSREQTRKSLNYLKDISLVRHIEVDEATCYYLHRVAREYARLKLKDVSDAAQIRQRFIDHYVAFVQSHRNWRSDSRSRFLLEREQRSIFSAAEVAKEMENAQAVEVLRQTLELLKVSELLPPIMPASSQPFLPFSESDFLPASVDVAIPTRAVLSSFKEAPQ